MAERSGLTVGYEKIADIPDLHGRPAALQEVKVVPGSGALAALDTGGVVWVVEDGAALATPLVDLRGAGVGFSDVGREAGLRSIAFHPDFAKAGTAGYGKLYLGYSATIESAPAGVRLFDWPGQTVFHEVVAEFTVADPAAPVVDPSTRRELYRLEQEFVNHNLGTLAFDTDAPPSDPDYGLLHVSHGDGGGAYGPFDLAQDPATPHGSILRIDPLGGGPGAAYGVPQGNPGIPGALPETFAYGFRNAQHFEFTDGLLWASDIGQQEREEINIVLPGGNYGWNLREGTLALDGREAVPLPADDAALGLHYPIAELPHSLSQGLGFAVGGGYVYGGDGVPSLEGAYIFSVFSDGRVYTIPATDLDAVLADGRIAPDEGRVALRLSLVEDDGSPTGFDAQVDNPGGRADLRFAEDAMGEILFFGKHRGEILRIVDPGPEVVTFDGPARHYILRLDGAREAFEIENKAGGTTPFDSFAAVDLLAFADGFSFVAQGRVDLRAMTGAATLAEDRLESLAELYIACFDRAPDALGLYFWADALAGGLTLEEAARQFLTQPEYAALYPQGQDTAAFVAAVYDNVLGRDFDEVGRDFWVAALDGGGVTRDGFLLEFLDGARRPPPPGAPQDAIDQRIADRGYLSDKVDLGLYYAVTKGLSDVEAADAVMDLFDGTPAGLAAAVAAVEARHAEALDPAEGEFLVTLSGVIDDPFAG